MMTSGEFTPQTPLQMRVGDLLSDVPTLETDINRSPSGLNIETVRLLQHSFPEINAWQLTAPIFERQAVKLARSSKWILKAIGLIPRHTDTPSISFSEPFSSTHRVIRGTPREAEPWIWLVVDETKYEGTITINGQEFSFDSNQSVIRASSNWLNSDGRQIENGITYHYVPHRNIIKVHPPQDGLSLLPYINNEAEPLENLRSIVEMAFNIER